MLKDNSYIKINNSIGLFKNVHLIGQVAQEEINKFYKMADIFVCTSGDELLGLVILEAMSYGKTIIASNVGGIPEIIDDQISGILIPKDDSHALMSNIIRLWKIKNIKPP